MINGDYSTTKYLTKEKPILNNNSSRCFDSVLFLPESEYRNAEGGLRTKGYFKKSYEDKPLISVITVVFNGERYLEQTIKSVIEQSYDNVEYIIIDGGSTDGTLDIIRKYENQIDYWVSERDKGIYDAMNKGIKCCSGNYIGLLNSDDYYHQNTTIEAIIDRFKIINAELIYGNLSCEKDNKSSNWIAPSAIQFDDLLSDMIIPHPTVFISQKIYKKYGLYNEVYKICSDYELLLRLILNNVDSEYMDKILVNMSLEGVSSSFSSSFLIFKERFLIRRQFVTFRKVLYYLTLDIVKFFIKVPLAKLLIKH